MATVLKSRAGAAKLGTPLMILCFLSIGGFLYWLSVTAEPTETATEEAPIEEEASGTVVAFSDFSAGPTNYLGQEISLEGVPVTSLLGPHSLWTSLSAGGEATQAVPYLLHFTESALADSVEAMSGSSLNVTGTVMVMSDSILDAWEAAGAFPQESDRFQAEFAEDFMEVTSVADAGAGADEPSS